MAEILDMLYTLSATVEKQNQEICELKELVKSSLQHTSKALSISSKSKETMATRLFAAIRKPASNSGNSSPTSNIFPASNISHELPPAIFRGEPHIILDIGGCDISLKERPFSEIKRHLQSCLQSHEGTKTVLLKGMNKDTKKDHRYVFFFYTDEDEKVTRIHTGQWLSITFP